MTIVRAPCSGEEHQRTADGHPVPPHRPRSLLQGVHAGLPEEPAFPERRAKLVEPRRRRVETREERIRQFHEENDTPVIGLREGAILRIEQGTIVLRGNAGARLFRRGSPPMELQPGSIGELLRTTR